MSSGSLFLLEQDARAAGFEVNIVKVGKHAEPYPLFNVGDTPNIVAEPDQEYTIVMKNNSKDVTALFNLAVDGLFATSVVILPGRQHICEGFTEHGVVKRFKFAQQDSIQMRAATYDNSVGSVICKVYEYFFDSKATKAEDRHGTFASDLPEEARASAAGMDVSTTVGSSKDAKPMLVAVGTQGKLLHRITIRYNMLDHELSEEEQQRMNVAKEAMIVDHHALPASNVGEFSSGQFGDVHRVLKSESVPIQVQQVYEQPISLITKEFVPVVLERTLHQDAIVRTVESQPATIEKREWIQERDGVAVSQENLAHIDSARVEVHRELLPGADVGRTVEREVVVGSMKQTAEEVVPVGLVVEERDAALRR